MLDYFDAFLIGLTATPDQRTYGFFSENVVAEYAYEIATRITQQGAVVEAQQWVDHRDRQTRRKRWAAVDEDIAYDRQQIDRSVVNPSQIRQVVQAMKTAVEVLLFMRDVRSRGYYEQMKGRGVRSLSAEGLQRVSGSADGAKARFVLIDAVGAEKSLKTESRPLEKQPTVPLKDLLQGVALGVRDEDTVLSLANRLVRLARQLDEKALAWIEQIAGGVSVCDLGKGLVAAVNPDAIVATALDTARAQGITRTEDTLLPAEVEAARVERVAAACAPFDDPARRDREQVIDSVNLDQVVFAGFSAQAQDQARAVIASFAEALARHRDEIAALGFFYQQPYQRQALTVEMIEALHEHLSRPPLMLTTERLWGAYARVQAGQVKDHLASSCSIGREDFDFAELAGKGGLQRELVA